MPRLRIIILDQTPDDVSTYRIVLWADVPAARQVAYANANATSAWRNATAPDIAALVDGSVVERVMTQRLTQGTGMAAMQSFLQQQWTAFQAEINATNPWQRYNSTWDGTAWVVANNG